ncbi:MAG TPA: dihydropteroate synthase [Bacteroidia bacterium]|jgi:dihydropteroate synthase|nr:dihydropteroate synthase [Bacteroidia bacterium]
MSPQGTNFKSKYKLRANGKVLNLVRPAVMGIINLTPDSFYDGGTLNSQEAVLQRADKYINEGATILDLGAVSTRPGAKEVSEDEELRRLLPALKLLRNTFPGIFISVDTHRSVVALAAAEEGADMINDISGGTFDKEMFNVVAQTKLPYVLMHIQGTPQKMQQNPKYKNVSKEVFDFLKGQIKKAKAWGIKQIITDVGFGFGKTVGHNFTLLRDLKKFEKLNCAMLIGLSRKSMVNKILDIKSADALNGTTVLHTIALLNGANILRVHDVKEAIEVIKLTEAARIK